MNTNWQLYSCLDAAVTYKIWQELQAEPNLPVLAPWYDLAQQMLPVTNFMSTHGLRIDTELLAAEHKRVGLEINRVQETLNELVGFELNVNSSKQCIGYFYGILGHAPYVGKGGNPTCDDKALARLVRKGIPAAKLVQRIRGLEKLRSTYLEIEYDDDGRLRCSVKITGTRTSRLSTAQTIFGTGGNMQNLPPAFRTFLVPEPGHFFVEMDKAKAEWVITAYVADEQNMIQALESGVDVHAYTGSRIFNVPLELVLAEDKLIGKSTDEDDIAEIRRTKISEILPYRPHRSMSVRQAGKKTNHACNYMMGVNRFALENEMSQAEARPLVEGYSRSSYPGLPQWWDRVGTAVRVQRYVENCFGRRFYFFRNPDYKLQKDAVSTIPQATSVEVLNRAMVEIYNSELPFMAPLRLGMQIHDSLLFQYPRNNLHHAALAILEVKRALEPTLRGTTREFTIDTDLAVGLNWGDASTENPSGMRKLPLLSDAGQLEKQLEKAVGGACT